MAENSGFWTTSASGTGHQVSGYTQVHHSKSLQIAGGVGKTEGVAVGYLNELKPTVGGKNSMYIQPGGALVDGKWYENTGNVNFTIPNSVSGTARKDLIVARATWASYKVELVRIAGTDSSTPTTPAMTRNSGSIYDVPICEVLVNSAGDLNITDLRALNLSGLSIVALGNTSILTAGDGVFTFAIPETLSGLKVLRGDIALDTASTSGTVSVQAALDGVDVFSTKPACPANVDDSSDSGGTRGVASSQPLLKTGARLRIDIDGAGTGAKGLTLHLVLGG